MARWGSVDDGGKHASACRGEVLDGCRGRRTHAGRSKMTVYRLVHSGELPAIRVGRSFRVPEKAVHDYLEGSFFEAG